MSLMSSVWVPSEPLVAVGLQANPLNTNHCFTVFFPSLKNSWVGADQHMLVESDLV